MKVRLVAVAMNIAPSAKSVTKTMESVLITIINNNNNHVTTATTTTTTTTSTNN